MAAYLRMNENDVLVHRLSHARRLRQCVIPRHEIPYWVCSQIAFPCGQIPELRRQGQKGGVGKCSYTFMSWIT